MAAVDRLLLGGWIAKWSYRAGLLGALRVTTHELEDSRLAVPLVVAFASDFHSGPTTHPEVFDALADRLAAAQPDVLLLGGDYVFCRSKYVDAFCDSLSRCLAPPLGTYAVLGNHDLWADEKYITSRLAMRGVRVLVNENVPLPQPFDCVSICGIDDPWAGEADARKTFSGAN